MGQLCVAPRADVPGGYCIARCDNTPCPSDATCVTTQDGDICLLSCTSADDCRMGYDCLSDGQVSVCSPIPVEPPAPPIGTKPGGLACTTPEVTAPGAGQRTFGANVGPISQHTGGVAEAETAVAVSPGEVFVAFNDLSSGLVGMATSHDDGATFKYLGDVPATTLGAVEPSVAVDAAGTVYVAWLGYDVEGMMASNMSVFVAKTTDHGATFSDPVAASDPDDYIQGQSFLDRPWIAASADGVVYVSYTVFNQISGHTELRMTRSRDKAVTFGKPSIQLNRQVRPGGQSLTQQVVDAAGNVHAVWVEVVSDGGEFGAAENGVYYARLPAGADTVTTDVKVSGSTDSVVFDGPTIAVSGTEVFVGYVAGTPAGAWDVKVAASADGGGTFKPGVTVNDDGPACATHVHQQIAVDDAGGLHLAWFDNRYKTGNVMYARSSDKGVTWSKNEFVNTQGFEFSTASGKANWLGDHLSLITSGKTIYCAWTDPRRQSVSHIYFAKGALP
jgi:hypothetical protein